jgi:uncharacterized protein DUF6551
MSYQDKKFVEEEIQTRDLEVDPRIQRDALNYKKVERIVRNFNPAALQIVTVSRRNAVTHVILDGWHRWQAVKELTDNQGTILCHVYEKLTSAEEAQLFLDLNYANQPTLLEKFRARIVAEDPIAMGISDLVHSYGWTVSAAPTNGNIQAVGALERIYNRSVAADADPNYLQMTLLIITRAWGSDRFGAQAVLLEGLSSFYSVHQDQIDLDRLINKLQLYPNGPQGLHSDATQLSSVRRGQVAMSVAELVTDDYNKGKTSKRLPVWKKRRP